jgi:hypothetical protein
MMGEFPPETVDHKDTDGQNDIWINLRLASESQQMCNQNIRCTNTSGFKGVSYRKDRRKWQVYIWLNYKKYHLGLFEDFTMACKVREKAAVDLHGEFVRF